MQQKLRTGHVVILGCGYLGRAVARSALTRGFAVTALTRNRDTAAALGLLGVRAVVADLASGDWHPLIDSPVAHVVNCVSGGGGGAGGYRRSYVDGMRSAVRWANTLGGIGTFLYTGSTSVYPQGDGVTVDEDCPLGGEGERTRHLRQAEAILFSGDGRPASDGRGYRRAVVLRLAGLYGPGRHHLLEQVRSGQVSGQPEVRLNLVHRDDACTAIWAALDADAAGDEAFNIADGAPASKAEVTAWLATRLGLPGPVFTGVPVAGRRTNTPDRIISSAKARRLLGWKPRFPTFRDGYESILEASRAEA